MEFTVGSISELTGEEVTVIRYSPDTHTYQHEPVVSERWNRIHSEHQKKTFPVYDKYKRRVVHTREMKINMTDDELCPDNIEHESCSTGRESRVLGTDHLRIMHSYSYRFYLLASIIRCSLIYV